MRKADLVEAILDVQGGEEVDAPELADEPGAAEDEPAVEEEPGRRGGRSRPDEEPDPVEEEPEVVEEPTAEEEIAAGVLDILPNGSGFVRVEAGVQSREDVYISPAQIRRCELRAGDEVSGPVRPPRRNERHPSLVRVETVNGAPRRAARAASRSSPTLTAGLPARAPRGGPRAWSTARARGSPSAGRRARAPPRLLREFVSALADKHPELSVQVVLAGVRPEELTEWSASAGVPVSGGAFDRSPEAQAQAAELAVERAKRRPSAAVDAAVVIDSLEALPPAVQRRVFGAGRATEEAGSVTVIAATGSAVEPLRWATTRVVLAEPEAGAATLRPDALGA